MADADAEGPVLFLSSECFQSFEYASSLDFYIACLTTTSWRLKMVLDHL